MTNPTPPTLNLPRYHVWMLDPEGSADPRYVGIITVRNVDQLTAESQAKALSIRPKEQPWHLTNLWIWAAMVREGHTSERFHALVKMMEWQPIKDSELEEEVDDEDPTVGAEDHSIGSD